MMAQTGGAPWPELYRCYKRCMIQALFVGLVGPLVLHFLQPVLLQLQVLAFHLTPLLFRHGMVASQTILGLFGLECLVLPARSHTSYAFVVAPTVKGLHFLYPVQGGILPLPIALFADLIFLGVPLFLLLPWRIHGPIQSTERHTRPPTHVTYGKGSVYSA